MACPFTTVGVEWEFIYVHEEAHGKEAGDQQKHHLELIQRHLQSIVSGNVLLIDKALVGRRTPSFWFNTWIVGIDDSIETDTTQKFEDGSCKEATTEISSCVFDPSEPITYSTLRQVTASLQRWFQVKVNKSCAFQVHIGLDWNQPVNPWSSLTAKKVGTLLWFAEGRLEKLCHTGRREGCHADRYRGRLTKKSRLALIDEDGSLTNSRRLDDFKKWVPSLRDHKLEQKMEVLWAGNEARDVFKYLCVPNGDPSELALNFKHVAGLGDSETKQPKRTVEFRLMEATWDEKTVTNWVMVCSQIVETAVKIEVEAFKELILKLKDDDIYTVYDFLEDCGCGIEINAHFFNKKLMEEV